MGLRRFAAVLLVVAAVGCDRHRSYMRHPLIHEMDVTTGAVKNRENATQADPYPPPRPVLPTDANFAAVSR